MIEVDFKISTKQALEWVGDPPFAICDIIKVNESDVGNVDFEFQTKRGNSYVFAMN